MGLKKTENPYKEQYENLLKQYEARGVELIRLTKLLENESIDSVIPFCQKIECVACKHSIRLSNGDGGWNLICLKKTDCDDFEKKED